MILASKIQEAIDYAKNNNVSECTTIVHNIERYISVNSDTHSQVTQNLLDKLKQKYNIPTNTTIKNTNTDFPQVKGLDFPEKYVKEGNTLVTCCMNRNENLAKALPSWLARQEISEIIIVDWSSDSPVREFLSERGFNDPRIRVIRVNKQSRWILSYAFNIGFRASRFDKIIKTDADIIIKDNFFNEHKVTPKEFYAGNWKTAKTGQEHINGFFYLHRKDLMQIKGFNEFITTYGWDDDDIYKRLVDQENHRKDIVSEAIYHIPHDDSLRLGKTITNTQTAIEEINNSTLYNIRVNRFVSLIMPSWNKDRHFRPVDVRTQTESYLEIEPKTPLHYVPENAQRLCEYLAAQEMLSWQKGHSIFELPRDKFELLINTYALKSINKDLIQTFLQTSAGDLAKLVKPERRKLYIDVQHGLGNRLRAFASAFAIAKKNNLELIVIWIPDDHCECRFSDLFEYAGTVIEAPYNPNESSLKVYNYMEVEEGAEKDKLIEISNDGDIYARSAYVLNHPDSHWILENEALQQLKPSKKVLKLIEEYNVNSLCGVHVRMEAGKGLDQNSWDSIENWLEKDHEDIQFWREKSHYKYFMNRIDKLIEQDNDFKFYLATDLQENYDAFSKVYGDRMIHLPRKVYDRSAEQIQYALADAILLSRCKILLASNWSSFSELAMRLSTTIEKVEYSGKDF